MYSVARAVSSPPRLCYVTATNIKNERARRLAHLCCHSNERRRCPDDGPVGAGREVDDKGSSNSSNRTTRLAALTAAADNMTLARRPLPTPLLLLLLVRMAAAAAVTDCMRD